MNIAFHPSNIELFYSNIYNMQGLNLRPLPFRICTRTLAELALEGSQV